MFRRMLLVLFIVTVSFLFLPDEAAAAGCDPANIIISEIDYTQPGNDNSEFVELYFLAAATVDNCEVHLIDGSGGYDDHFDLTGGYSAGAFVVLGNGGIAYDSGCTSGCMTNGPGGVALVDTSGGSDVVQAFVSYETSPPGAGSPITYLGEVSEDIDCTLEGVIEDQSCNNGPESGNGDWDYADPTPGSAAPTAVTMFAFSVGATSNAARVLGLTALLLAIIGFTGWVLNRRRFA